jgi:hypothetical protein
MSMYSMSVLLYDIVVYGMTHGFLKVFYYIFLKFEGSNNTLQYIKTFKRSFFTLKRIAFLTHRHEIKSLPTVWFISVVHSFFNVKKSIFLCLSEVGLLNIYVGLKQHKKSEQNHICY